MKEVMEAEPIHLMKQRLFTLIKEKAYLRRTPPEEPFKLASGGTSYVYFDAKQVTQDPEGITLIGKIILQMIRDTEVEAIGGLESGAIPIATAVSLLSNQEGLNISAFWIRKEPKTHGTMRWIEGQLKLNSKVIIVDDVVTKGSSVMKAVEKVREIGCQVLGVVAIVDREEGCGERLRKEGIRFTGIFKKSDFE
ncbi:MAG: orotate phosphoribosyltransferase [Thermoproteota archaeon]